MIARSVHRDIGEDEALGRHDLLENSLHRIIGAVGRAHDDPQGAARPDIHLADRVGEPVRPPPLRDVQRVGPELEHQLGRRVEDSGEDDVTFGHCYCLRTDLGLRSVPSELNAA
ncbi:MAG TPA: hypothetical protein VHT04_07955 [Stellaceae bacterium]|nr:hypothetical protein [Stellaceae bacterium]